MTKANINNKTEESTIVKTLKFSIAVAVIGLGICMLFVAFEI